MFEKFKKFAKQELATLKREWADMKQGIKQHFKSGFSDGYYIGAIAAAVLLVVAAATVSVTIPVAIAAAVAGSFAGKGVVKGLKSFKRRKNARAAKKIAAATAPQNALAAKSDLGNKSVDNKFNAAVNNKADQTPAVVRPTAAPNGPNAA